MIQSLRRPQRDYTYLGASQTLCPTCNKVVEGVRVMRDDEVYLRRRCPEHGLHEALISSDARWFLDSLGYAKPGWVPYAFSTEAKDGCPRDCGLCPDHEQHSCLPIIEITDHCNLDCPICLIHNPATKHMSRDDFARIIEGLVQKEGTLDAVSISGGEPTLHPDLLALVDLATRPEIARVSLSTNGVRLAAEPELCRELARRKVYVNLQFDGWDAAGSGCLRGQGDHATVKRRALDNLEAAGVPTALVATLVQGVNERAVGDCLALLTERKHILSVVFQPGTHTGAAETFPLRNRMSRLTIPDVVMACEAQSQGVLKRADFLPMPCSHPSCFALTYLLSTEEGYVPLPRFMELSRYLSVCTNRATMSTDADLEEAMRLTIDDLWASTGQIPDSEKILRALKRATELMFPSGAAKVGERDRMRIGEGLVKSVYIHAFMDADTFEIERIRKCCTHYALPDGRLMPGCTYNLLYRGKGP